MIGSPTAARLGRHAVELVAQEGIPALSDGELARRAGVSEVVLDRAHGGAVACLLGAYDGLAEDLYRVVERCLHTEDAWEPALASALDALLVWCIDQPAAARLMFFEIMRGDHVMRRRRDIARQRMVDLLIEQYRRRPGAEDLPDLQFEVLWGAVGHAITSWIEDGREDELHALAPELDRLAAVFEPLAA
ncbi:MAG: hypothetical protein ACJ762_07255 [Solirubrobacteraceae bacterium]